MIPPSELPKLKVGDKVAIVKYSPRSIHDKGNKLYRYEVTKVTPTRITVKNSKGKVRAYSVKNGNELKTRDSEFIDFGGGERGGWITYIARVI